MPPSTCRNLPAPAGPKAPRRDRFLTALFQRRTIWREFLYHFAALLLAPFGFAYAGADRLAGRVAGRHGRWPGGCRGPDRGRPLLGDACSGPSRRPFANARGGAGAVPA